MALTKEQLEIVNQAKQQRASSFEPVTPDERVKSIVKSALSGSTEKQTGIVADIKGIGTDISESFSKRGEAIGEISKAEQSGSQGFLRSAFQKIGQVAGGASDVIGSVLMGGAKALTPQPIQEVVGDVAKAGISKVLDTKAVQDLKAGYESLDEASKKDLQAIGGILSLVTDVTGAGLAKKPVVSGVKKGMEVASDVAQATAKAVKPATELAGGIASTVADAGKYVADIPSRIAVNVGESQAKKEAIKTLGSPVVQKAAREGIDVIDLNSIKNIPKAEKPKLKKLADAVRDFAEDNTKTNPFEVVGQPIVSRLKIIDGQVKDYAKKLDDIAKGLEGQAVKNMDSIKQAVNTGLDNLKVIVDFDGKLNFVGSNLEGLGKSGNIVENIFKRINTAKDASDLHRLKKFIDENVSYGKRVEGLSGEAERLLKSWRKSIDDTLDTQFPSYNKVNTELAKRIQPLNDLKDMLKSADNLDTDLLTQKAGILARRITSAAPSNPEIKQILRNLDKFTKGKGKTLLSVERLQDFYNILNKYYDIAPKTGFKNMIKEGIEGAGSFQGMAIDKIKGFAGKSSAVRKKAFEDALAELLK